MQLRHSTYHSATYWAFKEISPNAFATVVHFFEQNKKEALALPLLEYYELFFAYTNALYELKSFDKFIFHSKVLLEESINDNIHFIKDIDIYKTTLFQKGVAHYFMGDGERALHHFKELYKLDNSDKTPLKMIKRVFEDDISKHLGILKYSAILTFSITMILLSAFYVYIRTSMPEYTEVMNFALFNLFCYFVFSTSFYILVPKIIGFIKVIRWEYQLKK